MTYVEFPQNGMPALRIFIVLYRYCIYNEVG